MQEFIRIRTSFTACHATLSVNGFIFYEHRGDANSTLGIPINEWIKNGENLLTIEILPITAEAGTTAETKANVEVVGAVESIAGQPLHASYPATDSSAGPRLTIPFFAAAEDRLSLYSDLITLRNELQEPLYRLYQSIYDAFVTDNEAAYLELIKYKNEDFSLAYSIPVSQEIRRQSNFFNMLKVWEITLKPASQLTLTVSPNGKQCYLTDRNNSAPIEFQNSADNTVASFPFSFGMNRHTNELTLIR